LFQNYPNPFNPQTIIGYQISQAGFVSLKVYDITGREVATLVNESQSQGRYEVLFNGSNLASGVYLYKLQVGDFSQMKKFVLMK
jgi:5-hydroxyisourate hydrolase-like protein (transthyretin family)